MFKELNDNLSSIEGEILKLKNAVTHIEQAKEAAIKAVNAAETTNKEFKEHLLKVTSAVDSILKPHQELIAATENLTKTIQAINFPENLKQIKMLVAAVGAIVIIGTVLILFFCHK
jgi:hypothetical protein